MRRIQDSTVDGKSNDAVRKVWQNRDGSTAVEYALIAAGVGAVIAASVYTLGDVVLNDLFETIADAFT